MMTADEFVVELSSEEGQKSFKLAYVVDLFANKTAKIQFDGEDEPSEKQYAYLESYTPKIFDRALLGVIGGTYVILGKVNYNIPPATGEELDRYLFDQKLVTMTKGLSVTGATALKSGATITGNLGVSGNITVAAVNATSLIATGNVTGANLSTTGTITANSGGTIGGTVALGEATFSAGATFNGGFSASSSYWCSAPYLRSTNSLSHTGQSIGFFGTSPQTRPSGVNYSTLYTSATLSDVITKVNLYINLLKRYGLSS